MKSSNGVPALVGTSNGALRWIRLRLPAWCRPNEENRRPPAQNIYCIGGNIKKKIETGVVRRRRLSTRIISERRWIVGGVNRGRRTNENGQSPRRGGDTVPRRDPPRGPLLDPPTNIIFRSRPPRRDPLIGHQSAPPTNSRVRYHSYQPARRGPNTPFPLQSAGRDKSRLTIMITTTMTEAIFTGGAVPVGEQPASSTLKGTRVPVVDLSWRYLPPPFSLGQICEKGVF